MLYRRGVNDPRISKFCSIFGCLVINTNSHFFRYTIMMNQQDIFKKIGQILTELNDQYQYLAQNPQELNELELELFLANASFLSDHVQIVKKLNTTATQKILPEHTADHDALIIEQLPAASIVNVAVGGPTVKQDDHSAQKGITEHDEIETVHISPINPSLEEDIFKIDNTPSPFEFILNEKPSSDKFEFEEKSVDEIFDRPLSKEEELIIAQKQRLREKDSLEVEVAEDDEIGPEPFLVSATEQEEPAIEQEGAVAEQEEPVAEQDVKFTAPEETVVGQEESATEEMEEAAVREELYQPATAIIADKSEIAATEKPVETSPAQPEPPQLLAPKVETWVPVYQQAAAVEKPELKPEAASAAKGAVAKPTLNDILSGNSGSRSQHAEKPRMAITDLKQAISLNDKMRYIKDLFNGYNLAYAEAIDLLNKMPDFKTAESFLENNYAGKNNWTSRQETADQFYELLHQRFPSK